MTLLRWAGGPILLLILMGSALAAPGPDSGEADETVRSRAVVGLPSEPGRWRSKVQLVFDPRSKALGRKTYSVLDTRPSRGLDFVWLPDDGEVGGPERATGTGRLVWRLAGRPSYDETAFVAEYHGRMKGGRPDGQGTWLDRDGRSYEGAWAAGRPHGVGSLKLGGGAEYVGRFAAGLADGIGRFYDVDGETFEGTFRRGLRDGRGRTVLPGGGTYESAWAAGEELPQSRRTRLAQLGPVAGAGDDVRLGITVDRIADNKAALQYATANSDAGLVIRPSSRRLMEVWKGSDDIQLTKQEENPSEAGSYGVFAFAESDVPPLTLVMEVQNRAKAPIRVTGAYLDVDASASDLQPAIQMTGGSSSDCNARERPSYSPTVDLENLGWGPAERAKLSFTFANARSNVRPSSFTLTKELGSINWTRKVSFEPELRAAGVRIDTLKQRDGIVRCAAKGNATACLAEIAASGLFGSLGRNLTLEDRDISLNAVGTLGYVWKDQKGAEQARTSPFTTRLLLARTPQEAECGEGAEKEPVAKKPLLFRLDQSRYRLPVAFERTIPAGRTSRYTVMLKAAKASEHKFKVVLQLADGRQITSRPIDLTYFIPNPAGRAIR